MDTGTDTSFAAPPVLPDYPAETRLLLGRCPESLPSILAVTCQP